MTASFSQAELTARLDHYFTQVDRLLLQRQNPLSGLFPASTAVTVHGDYTDAWVRDNVYSIQAVWGLALAYRKAGVDNTRAYLLEQSVAKLMRGLLLAMMRQAGKVERFKQTQDPLDALHAKYSTHSGEVVVADDKWGHLQLDATSIYLLMLAQMTRSGLRIIFNFDEVAFVQNLVHYISRAYRTPDYGIWERGNKINNGRPEINASSVGMAKAALEAMSGLNVFGADGDARSTIHVVADEVARSRATLQALLPRESLSKEVDAALLSIIGYPAFAVEDEALALRTREQVIAKLAGPYGLKRFLLDGHQTVIEDHSRLHYEDDELKSFANIESEWPLFYCYLLLDALFRADSASAMQYCDKLKSLAIVKDGFALLPELYYVPESALAAERAAPGTQPRVANHNLPLVWAQSLFLLGQLLLDGLLDCADIDPLLRHRKRTRPMPVVQIAIIAESTEAKAQLAAAGIPAQQMTDVPAVRFGEADDLSRVLQQLGRNEKLQLSGRPYRRLRSLATAQAYQIDGRVHLFFGQFQHPHNFYLTLDAGLLRAQLAAELAYVARHWDQTGDPILLLKIPASALRDSNASAVIALLQMLQSGQFASGQFASGQGTVVPTRLSTVTALLNTIKPVELAIDPPIVLSHIVTPENDLVSESRAIDAEWPAPILEPEPLEQWQQRLRSSSSLPEQLRLLQAMAHHHDSEQNSGLEQDSGLGRDNGLGKGQVITVRTALQQCYAKAATARHWAALRLAAGLLNSVHAGLDDAVAELIARRRQLVFGRAITSYVSVTTPLANDQIHALLRQYSGHDPRECLLNQEILIYLAMLVRANPDLLQGMLSIRTSYLLLLMISQLAVAQAITQDDAFEQLCGLPPHQLLERLRQVLEHYQDSLDTLLRSERLHYQTSSEGVVSVEFAAENNPVRQSTDADWRQWRLRAGTIGRHPEAFPTDIWHLLQQCPGIVLGDRYDKHNLLDAKAVHDATTPGEPAFALQLERLLNALPDPIYRQLTVEALSALLAFFRANPKLHLDERIVLDALLSYAVKDEWLTQHPADRERYNAVRQDAWLAFSLMPPHAVANAVVRAFCDLLEEGQQPVVVQP